VLVSRLYALARGDVALERLDCGRVQRKTPCLAKFALTDDERAAAGLDIADRQIERFRNAKAGAGDEAKERGVGFSPEG
jgi:hypothetical protein